MRGVWARRTWPVLVAGLVLAGCGSSGDDAEVEVEASGAEEATDDVQDEQAPADGADGELPGDGPDDVGDEAGEETSAEPTEREDAWPDPIPVESVGRHPAGLVVEIFEVRSEGSSTDLDVRITNGQSIDAKLNDDIQTPTLLVDDTEATYPLVPPADNAYLTVAAGEVLEGTLSFSGPLSPDATRLGLVINTSYTAYSRLEAETPHLVIDDMFLVEGAADGDGDGGGGSELGSVDDDGDDDGAEG